ncbi:hypothetical protein HL666_22805 [Bradyrhizobium sp. 83002]|nr:hypothetical protein [Bradyrhizobium aeschynomenes]NPU13604.1 hypothetical protein [Bradyrhizobium aeschynomenes]
MRLQKIATLLQRLRRPAFEPDRVDAHAARFAVAKDSRDLFDVACDAGLDALDTTPPEAYRSWLQLDPYSIRVFEDFAQHAPHLRRIQGYYTLFVLRAHDFDAFVKGRLRYEELSVDRVVRLPTFAINPEQHPGDAPGGDEVGLGALVFDMGARNSSLGPAYSRWIVADMLWRLDHLLVQNPDIDKVGIFATNKSSIDLAIYFEMKPVASILSERFPDWKIYLASRKTYFDQVRTRDELAPLYRSNVWTRSYEISPQERKLLGEKMEPIYRARLRRRQRDVIRRTPMNGPLECDVLIVVATKLERDTVLGHIKSLPGPRGYDRRFGQRRTYYDFGELGGARVAMVQCEMGAGAPGASQATASDAIDELRPHSVVLAGIAFGVSPDKHQIGSILISQQLRPYELQRVGVDAQGQLRLIARGDRVTASTRLLGRLRAAEADWDGAAVSAGLLLSGEKLVDNLDFRNQLTSFEPEAIGGEMEGAGLYAACADRNTDWIIVKAVCDWADGNKHENKRERQQLAAREAFGFVFHAIAQGGFARHRS